MVEKQWMFEMEAATHLPMCDQCGKRFQRKAHLIRHQQQHSGDRPYSCMFCGKTFKRSDVLRDHFQRCEQRGDHAIPVSMDRGRKRHACDECSRLKVKCDNNVPCRKCKEFGRRCVKSRGMGARATSSPDTTTSSTTPDLTSSDRNSIGFLLNCPGETDFMREFPKDSTMSPQSKVEQYGSLMAMRNERYEHMNGGEIAGTVPTGYEHMNGGELARPVPTGFEHMNGGVAGSIPTTYNGYGNVPTVDNNLEVFLGNLDFETYNRQNRHWTMPGENMLWMDAGTGPRTLLAPGLLVQRGFEIREKLRYTAATMNPPHTPDKELLQVIDGITPERIAKWIKLYFRHWHRHTPLIHEATFNPTTAALPLLLAVMSVGSMYSTGTEEVENLKMLLDTIESYIYSIPGLSDEYTLPGREYVRHGEESSFEWQYYQLEELQGAFVMIVLQYWAGNDTARRRVRQQRFSRFVAIFHRLEMQSVQHPPNFLITDQLTFRAWVLKESYVRTATLACMLDNAFGIFNNVSPRFQWAEIDLSFPSDERYFQLANYEEMVSFHLHPVQKVKIKDTFLMLFDGEEDTVRRLREGGLSALDMQMLIHFLYTQLWTHTYSNPFVSLPSTHIPGLVQPFKVALRTWKRLWDEIRREQVDRNEWEKLGFQRTAETYFETVGKLLEVFERTGGGKVGGTKVELKGDGEKGEHLRALLSP